MIGGMSGKKVALYAVLVGVLVAANAMRLGQDVSEVSTALPQDATPVSVPDLAVGRGQSSANPGTRDLFRPATVRAPAPQVVSAPTPKVEAKRPDPRAIALEKARERIDTFRLVGVVGSEDGALAILEQDGNTLARGLGEDIVSGFKLDQIAQNEIRLKNIQLGVIAVLSLGGTDPLQMIRVD